MVLKVVLLLCVSCASFTFGLDVVNSNAVLPTARAAVGTAYDGKDSIYLFGGETHADGSTQEILKYSISADTVEHLGTMANTQWGSSVWTGSDTLYYFGGWSDDQHTNKVWQWRSTNPNDMPVVGNLETACTQTSAVWDQGENIYVFGGFNRTYLNSIVKYSITNNSASVVAELPLYGREETSAVFDDKTGTAYIFGGYSFPTGGYLYDIVKYDTANNNVTTLRSMLPQGRTATCAVWTGEYAYIIGGTGIGIVDTSDLIRFDPATNEVTSIELSNFPSRLKRVGCAYVESLNRIYVFAGRIQDYYHIDDIKYIDLN